MSATLKIVHLNIEGSKHLDLVIPFLVAQGPDVVCLQELLSCDIRLLEEELGMRCLFAPMAQDYGSESGIGIFSRHPSSAERASQYGGRWDDGLVPYVHGDPTRRAGYLSSKFILLSCDLKKEGETFHVATTHFPVTPHGEATDFQREDMKRLLGLLEKEGEFVLMGDFNAPRGGEIFSMLSEKYKDNIPPHVTTSIDGAIHRAGQLPHMVDGIFSTPGYEVSNVIGHTGVSDHWAFTAEVKKVEI